jgi:hypothetical protein
MTSSCPSPRTHFCKENDILSTFFKKARRGCAEEIAQKLQVQFYEESLVLDIFSG